MQNPVPGLAALVGEVGPPFRDGCSLPPSGGILGSSFHAHPNPSVTTNHLPVLARRAPMRSSAVERCSHEHRGFQLWRLRQR